MKNVDVSLERAWEYYDAEDYEFAMREFTSIVDKKPYVLHHIGLMHYKGLGTKINHKKAKEFFVKSYKSGFKEGTFYLGRYEILHENKNSGFNLLVKAAKQGCLPAFQFLGAYFENGHIREPNVSRSLYYFNQGMKLNHAYCAKFLGQRIINNSNGFFSKICGYFLFLKSAWIIVKYGTRIPIDPRVDVGALSAKEDLLL